MPTTNVNFGEFLPSAPTFRNPGCVVADNVVPTAGQAYNPFFAPLPQGNVLDSPVRGAQQFYNNNNGLPEIFATSYLVSPFFQLRYVNPLAVNEIY